MTMKMSREMQQFLPISKKIMRVRESVRHTYVKDCDKHLIESFTEWARIIFTKNVPLNPAQLEQLKHQKKNVHGLASKCTLLNEKCCIVSQ